MKFILLLVPILFINLCWIGIPSNIVNAQDEMDLTKENKTIVPCYAYNNFSIIVLPDTQYYSESYPWIFENQTNWTKENKESLNIVFVTHLGDIVDHWWEVDEYENANSSLRILDEVVPYGVLPGNHDGAEEGGETFIYTTDILGTNVIKMKLGMGEHFKILTQIIINFFQLQLMSI